MKGKVEHWAIADGTNSEREQGPSTKITRFYWATLDSVNTDPKIIYDYKDCPKLGDPDELDKGALVIRIKVTQAGASKVYKVEVEWSTLANDADNNPNPLKRPAIIDVQTRLEEVETFRDGKGRIRINTAGDIQVGVKLKPIQTIRISKNVPKVPKWFHELPGHVNKAAITIDGIRYDKRTLLLGASERPDRILENKVWYYPITYELTHDAETHDTFEPSMGFHELVQRPSAANVNILKQQGIDPPVVNVKERITVGSGVNDYPNEPQYLDINGRHIELGPDREKGGLDTSQIYIIRRSDQPEAHFVVLPVK